MRNISDRLPVVCVYAALIVTTLAVYWPVRNHEFVNYDDSFYVYHNPDIQSGVTIKAVKWAFTTGHAGNWHPLTWISHMLDWGWFGSDPSGHHLTSLFLHLANALLLFAVLRRMTGAVWRSAFVAALFALHPLNVESVAWVAERKSVLSTFFWMLTMLTYLWYVVKPCILRYCLVLASLALGLMAKPMLVTLPCVLLLLDYWPLERIKLRGDDKKRTTPARLSAGRLIAEKIPLFAAVAASSIVTFIVQQKAGAMEEGEHFSFVVRAANASISYIAYIAKMIWPARLAMFYPHPGANISVLLAALSAVLLIIATVIVLRFSKGRRYLFVGWFWYVGTLVPVIGLIQVGDQAMADRYNYVPLIGLFIIMAWLAPDLLAKGKYKKHALTISALAVLTVFAVVTYRQQHYWKDTITLCNHALAATEDNYIAHFCMTESLSEQGRFDEAIWHNSQAVKIEPDYVEALNGLAVALDKAGRTDEAIVYLKRALDLNPGLAQARNNLGYALVAKGQFAEAVKHYELALKTLEEPVIHRNLAFALLMLGRYEQAEKEYRIVIQYEPDAPHIHNWFGAALFKQGKTDEAVRHFAQAIQIKTNFLPAYDNLGVARESQGKLDEAIDSFRKALAIEPNLERHTNLARALRANSDHEEAAQQYRQVIRIDPNDASAHNALGEILGGLDNFDEAIQHFSQAARLAPKSALVHYNLARALEKAGRIAESIEQYDRVLALKPDSTGPLNGLAWLLATHPDERFRDPVRAVKLAERACEVSDYQNAGIVDTLAAAYAAAGLFSEAVDAAETALELAKALGHAQFMEEIKNRLDLFKAGRAYINDE